MCHMRILDRVYMYIECAVYLVSFHEAISSLFHLPTTYVQSPNKRVHIDACASTKVTKCTIINNDRFVEVLMFLSTTGNIGKGRFAKPKGAVSAPFVCRVYTPGDK